LSYASGTKMPVKIDYIILFIHSCQ